MWVFNVVSFFFSSRRRHTRCSRDWSSDVCSSDLIYSRSPNTGPIRGDIAPAQVSKLRDNPVNLARCAKTFPAKPQVDGQAACDFPVILSEHGVVMSGVVAGKTRFFWGGEARGQRRFL